MKAQSSNFLRRRKFSDMKDLRRLLCQKSAVWHYRICNSSQVWAGVKRTEQGLKEIPSNSTVSEAVQEDKAAGTSQFSYSDTGGGAVICLRGGLTSSSGDNDSSSSSHEWIWRLYVCY